MPTLEGGGTPREVVWFRSAAGGSPGIWTGWWSMDIAAGPAALGGMMMSVALGAWMLGRWQGDGIASGGGGAGPAPVADPAAGAEAISCSDVAEPGPCPTAAQTGRDGAPPSMASLAELHDEIAAFRRSEQVFSRHALPDWHFAAEADDEQDARRDRGPAGEPCCEILGSGLSPGPRVIGCGEIAAGSLAAPAPQPSALPRDPARL